MMCMMMPVYLGNEINFVTRREAVSTKMILDGIVEDALAAGYSGINPNLQPVIDEISVIDSFYEEWELFFESKKNTPRIICVLLLKDNELLEYQDGDWSIVFGQEMYLKSEKNEGESNYTTIHEMLVNDINSHINKRIRDSNLWETHYEVQFTRNDGEEYVQTIQENSFIVVAAVGGIVDFGDKNSCNRILLSVATIK